MHEASKSVSPINKLILPSHFIGIGASAGGLEALQTLLQHLPTGTGACFVIVQHLSPDFKSMMLELLSKHTGMNIENVEDGVLAKPNTIYLLPPKKTLIVAQGELLLSDKIPDSGLSLPIDTFFRSLAEDQQHRAIGIILSGTGSDGSRGVKALKEAGALVIAQEPDSAKFDGMPNSAINTGIVDMILRPEVMGEKLAEYIKHPLVSGQSDTIQHDMESSTDLMGEVFSVLRTKSNIDFSKYKPSTIARRIERRMTIKQVNSLQEYLMLLFKDSYEVEVLSKELLIGVTRFFRDDEAFKVVKDKVIPEIVSKSKDGGLIRAWVAACSSGEEAYSVAILLSDEVQRQGLKREIKVFATDINQDAISEASAGVYSEDIVHDVPAPLLTKYFTQRAAGDYQVSQQVRHMVVFATHNMIVDPPFSNLDLVTCRNVLIYFQQSAQKRVLSSLHFALKRGGHLFLGSSENLGELSSHFKVISDRERVFQKTSDTRLPISTNSTMPNTNKQLPTTIPSVSTLMKNYRGQVSTVSSISFANEALITEYVPPCLLLNDEFQAIHVYGDVSKYVKRLPPGRISTEVSDMVNEDIGIAVMSALQRAKQKGEVVYYTDMSTNSGTGPVALNMRVSYVKEHDLASAPGYFWVVFEPSDEGDKASPKPQSFDAAEQAKQRIEDLELELKFSKEHLQVTVEELETTNEELQSANEELMSANEELQSTNEELQSVNEELYTVNSEYQEKISEISQANGDLDEVLGLAKIGIIFLDENMLIRRYTDAVKAYVNVLESDVNRPLHHISQNISYDNMLEDVASVFRTSESIEKELTLPNKRLLRITISAYTHNDVDQTKGVAIVFSDISRVKYTELGMEVAYKQLRSSVNNALDMLDTAPFSDNLTVLLLDDNQNALSLLSENLKAIESYKCNIHTATSVEQAIESIKNNDIDICISDYYLDDETAIDFIDALKPDQIRLPVIVTTGNLTEQLSPMLLSHGALDLIEKEDITPALLDKSMRYAVRRQQIDDQIDTMMVSNSEELADENRHDN
ncbi:CheR family methyltransferase [Ningiella sp. W23]|uniref:CheR family methyltransferase n=1 Tax=Ningiella sp. W23 TaxID=3023715 RepID=UPI003757C4B4